MSHDELIYELANALKEKAKEQTLRIKTLNVDRIYFVSKKKKQITINMDVALILAEIKLGTLFVFEVKRYRHFFFLR